MTPVMRPTTLGKTPNAGSCRPCEWTEFEAAKRPSGKPCPAASVYA
ncbi:MAG: hypothetical protein PUI53_00065 [Butyricicoccus porcorum]|nr:hypothetical protein [Butyricicoccus porcorum]